MFPALHLFDIERIEILNCPPRYLVWSPLPCQASVRIITKNPDPRDLMAPLSSRRGANHCLAATTRLRGIPQYPRSRGTTACAVCYDVRDGGLHCSRDSLPVNGQLVEPRATPLLPGAKHNPREHPRAGVILSALPVRMRGFCA